jgi:restriction system protein
MAEVTRKRTGELLDLWTEYYGKLTEDARQRLPLKPIYFLAPEA